MSAIRNPATITSVGRRMMTAGGDITYTKAVLYGQDISHLTREQLESLTSIGNPLVTVPLGISDKNDNGNGTTVILEATFQNSNLKADLPYTAVGFFAKRGDDAEKLIAVGVATEGAYLAATSPDGVATDALDIKVAIAIGDSANVTAMIDPAGSVTPAALHNAITDVKSEMKTGLDTKADKQTVTDDLATKADKTDVDAQIGTVNKSVSDLSDTVKANKDDADKTLATKADKATVESDLATKANQSDLDETNSEVAKKADSEDVNAQLATKANSKDVNAALALKDDTADVDDKISNVAKSVSDLSATVTANKKATDSTLATKANASDVADSLATKADKTDVASDVKSLNDAINTKASQADLDKTNAVVATKANATALADYARTVDVDADLDTKANKTDLESLAKTADVNSALDTKADKTTVDGDVKTLQASIDTKADKTALDDYAKSADVASDVKTLTDSIATKADAKTVNDAISKIDFTPYAKSADVAKDLQGYTTTADLTKLLAGKRDIADSYSRDELDKKFLQLSTDTSGKVSADQIAKLLASKVDKTDLTSQLQAITDSIGTKANSANVTAELAKKDNTADVDAKIKTVTDLANTKVDATYSYSKAELDKKLLALSTDISGKVNATQVASMIADKADKTYVDNQIATIDFGKIKFRKQYINSDGRVADKTWSATKNKDGTYTIDLWQDDWTASKLTGVLVQLPNKADTSTVNAQIADAKNTAQSNLDKVKSDLNGAINTKANSSDLTALDKKAVKSVGIYPNNLHFENGSFNYWSGEVKASPDANGYALIDLNDDASVNAAAYQLNAMLTGLNHLQGKQTKDSADANALSETGVYYCSSPAKNFPVGQWGTLVTSNGNGERASQLYFPDDNSAVWFRTLNGDWQGWVRLANIGDVNNAESSLTSSINAVNNKVNVTVPLFHRITAGNTWNDILGASNGNTPVLVSIRDEGGANTLGNFSAAVAFGGGDTKGVLNVAYSDHTARIIGGNGNAPVWHEDIAWKSDINSLNSTISALQQTVQSLQNTVNQQATQITGLQTQVNNQAQDIAYIKANYIEGKRFSKANESQATAWEKENSQRIAFITDN